MGIPPITNPVAGAGPLANPCPDGYQFDPTSGLCLPVRGKISITSTGLNLPDVDPKNAAELAGLGTQDSNLAERFALAWWHMPRRIGKPPSQDFVPQPPPTRGWLGDQIVWAMQEVLNLYDWAISIGVGFMGDSATRNQPGFWKLIGALISDLLGVTIDGTALYASLQQRGTVAAMVGVGSGLVDLLIGEFTGTASGTGGNVTFSSSPNTETGLPPATLTPAGGVLAAKALMGFVLSSAVRQGNLEAISAELGPLAGHVDKFSEAMRANLGIGRMLRFALRPIFQDLIAGPMKWAINKQYTPHLLNAAEAVRAVNSADVDEPTFAEELARDGYASNRVVALRRQHTLNPEVVRLLTMRAAGKMVDQDFDLWMRRHGYSSETAALVAQASDLEPARRTSLALVEHYMLEYGRGNITAEAFRGFVDALKGAAFLLSPGEVAGIESVAASINLTTKLRPRHLTIGQLTTGYIDGVVTLQEFRDHLTALGYGADDLEIETEVLLLKAKAAADAAAARAAKAKAKASGSTPPVP